MDNDIEIFKGKKFSDLCKDIYNNSKNTRNQVEILISELRTFIKGINDVMVIVPIIRDYLDVSVKNDDQLVKLAAIVQRISTKQVSSEGDFQLSEQEKEDLMKALGSYSSPEINVDSVVESAKEKLNNV